MDINYNGGKICLSCVYFKPPVGRLNSVGLCLDRTKVIYARGVNYQHTNKQPKIRASYTCLNHESLAEWRDSIHSMGRQVPGDNPARASAAGESDGE